MAIHHDEKIGGTERFGFAVDGWVQLVKSGNADGTNMAMGWDNSAYYVTNNGELVGVLAYTKVEWMHDIFITIAWVKSGHRKAGHYARMYKALRMRRNIEMPDYTISGGIMEGNKRMQAVARKMGRIPVATVYREPPFKGRE